jgi:uncharacterized SAM-dependent methyltransferase
MTFIAPMADQREVFRRDAVDLLTLQRSGHAGRWTYDGNWGAFVGDNPVYHTFVEQCGLFALHAEALAKRAGNLGTALDIGASSREAFVRMLLLVLARMPDLREFISLDICDAFPAATAEVAGRWLPGVKLTPVRGDFYAAMPALREPVLAFFLGSTISNIVLREGETLTQGITRTLTWFANALPQGSKFILSYDSCHDPKQLERAYDHPIFAAMERGIVTRMNRELGLKGMTVNDVRFVATWFPERHLWELGLELLRNVEFDLGGIRGRLEAGQRLWTGSCYKPPDTVMGDAVAASPFRPEWRADGPNMRLLMLGR